MVFKAYLLLKGDLYSGSKLPGPDDRDSSSSIRFEPVKSLIELWVLLLPNGLEYIITWSSVVPINRGRYEANGIGREVFSLVNIDTA